MKTAVLYARFSCSKQREVSIDDQLRGCYEYCERENIKAVKVYCDYAMSGTNDHRPDFQSMITNAPESDYVVVYMMERFSRGKYDPSIYKKKLDDKGVKVISALEYIPDAPEGIMIEKILEGQAAYFSLDVARKTRRGMVSNAEKCLYNGYPIFGYDVDPDTRRYVINDEKAATVREIFRRYMAGETINRIAWALAMRGIKTSTGNPVDYGWVFRMLHNERYTGVYIWDSVAVPGGMPQIIDEATYRMAQGATRKKVYKMEERIDYPLTGKLYCAICGHPMTGKSARKKDKRYNYYRCKKGSGCERKAVRKELVEGAVVQAVSDLVNNEGELSRIAQLIKQRRADVGNTGIIKATEQSLREAQKAQQNILKAIEQGIMPKGTKERLAELEQQEERISAELSRLEIEAGDIDEDSLIEFLQSAFKLDDPDLIMRAFVNRVYLFDGYAVVTMNYRRGGSELAEVKIELSEFAYNTNGARGESRTRTSLDNGF